MKPGGGKAKGAGFERDVCKILSLWVSGGERTDLFWRSAMSGGRATVSRGEVRQAGDICAVAPEGHSLTDRFYIECKHVKNLDLVRFFLFGEGSLADYWRKAQEESAKYGRDPIIIARQNRVPTLLIRSTSPRRHALFHENKLTRFVTTIEQLGAECEVYQLDDVVAHAYNPGAPQKRVKLS